MQAFVIGIVALRLVLDVGVAETRRAGAPRDEIYRSAAIDADGNLAIVRSDGQAIIIRKEADQTAFSEPALSPARTAVGVQAFFPNCCTSYDIPLQLVVYARGKVHRFKGIELPIFQWGFADSGTRVAFGQEPVHFGCSTHFELRDIESERLIESANVPQPCGQNPDPKVVKIPRWVTDLITRRQ